VPGGNGPELIIARVCPGALEEDPDLGLPPLEIGAEHRDLLVVSEFPAAEALRVPAHPQFAGAGDAQVTDPLGFAARGDEVTPAVVGEQVHEGRGLGPEVRPGVLGGHPPAGRALTLASGRAGFSVPAARGWGPAVLPLAAEAASGSTASRNITRYSVRAGVPLAVGGATFKVHVLPSAGEPYTFLVIHDGDNLDWLRPPEPPAT